MTKILLGQSYYLRFDPKLWEAMQPYPPLGTLYAASYLREGGYQVALFDAMLAESETEWEASLARHKPDFAVIYEDNFNYLSKMCLLRMREAAFTMIQMARKQGCQVILCGADVTDHYETYLAKGADFILLGEGEHTLRELINHLSGREEQALEEIQGLAWRSKNGVSEYCLSGRRSDIRNLDDLPFPAWDLVDISRYKQLWHEHHGYYSMNMVTTRGCPYHCNWCAKPIWGQRYNVRSPENVVAEMKWLKEAYQPDHLWFADDIMGLKPGWLPRFAYLVEAMNVRIPFKCLSRVDLLLREGEIEALKRAGAQIVWVGAESGSQKIITAMEKGTRVEQIYQVRDRLRESDIQVGFFLQFGYPGETWEDIQKTLQMVRDTMPDDIGISVSYPLPGTKFFERVRDQLGDKQNWYDSDDMAMMYVGPYSTEFYRQLHTVMHKEFRARTSWEAFKSRLRDPIKIKFSELRKWAAMVYHTISLPVARYRLRRLKGNSATNLGALSPGLTDSEAATPTPQTEI